MATRWEPCPAIVHIEGRGPVRCWRPPAPGSAWCLTHAPGAEAQPQDPASPTPDPTEAVRRLLELAKQIQSDCPVCRRWLSGVASALFDGDRLVHTLCWRER